MTDGDAGPQRADAPQAGDLVLVVDDEPAMRMTFQAALQAEGFTVVTAASGGDGLRLAREQRPSVILLDANLPDMTGEEVLRQIRAAPSPEHPAVLIVSGDQHTDRKVEGLRLGADDYVTKPVELAELVARVRRHAGSRQRWLAQLDAALDSRRRLAQLLADLDPSAPVHVLVHQLFETLSLQLSCEAVSLSSAVDGAIEHTVLAPQVTRHHRSLARGAAAAVRQPVVNHGEQGWTCHAPLENSGSCFGVLGLAGTGDDQRTLSALVDLAPQIAGLVHRPLTSDATMAEQRRGVEALLDSGGYWPEFQPIVHLASGSTVGFEALTRFPDGTPPDRWFRQATRVGLGAELELAAIERVLDEGRRLPPECWLSVNVSAHTLIEHDLRPVLSHADRRVILEITEHDRVRDYQAITERLRSLGDVGLGVDDAGSGYASLRHIFELHPELVKLDRTWIDGVHQDPVRTALISGLLQFATELDAVLLGEGVEQAADRATLERLGVSLGQGFLFGPARPAQHWS